MLRDIVWAAFRRDVESREEDNKGDETGESADGAAETGGFDAKTMDNGNYPAYLYHFN